MPQQRKTVYWATGKIGEAAPFVLAAVFPFAVAAASFLREMLFHREALFLQNVLSLRRASSLQGASFLQAISFLLLPEVFSSLFLPEVSFLREIFFPSLSAAFLAVGLL